MFGLIVFIILVCGVNKHATIIGMGVGTIFSVTKEKIVLDDDKWDITHPKKVI